MKLNDQFYEEYHEKDRLQKKVIKENQFTYKEVVGQINECLVFLGKDKLKIYDLGCGSGTLSFYLAKKGFRVYGTDISNKGIEACNKNARNLGLDKKIIFEIKNFPEQLPNQKFDLIIFSEVFEHIPNELKAVKSLYKLLNKNGILYISVPSVNSFCYKTRYSKKVDEEVGHLRRYTAESLSKILTSENFKIIKIIKFEGLIRNFLFSSKHMGLIIKILNNSNFFSLIFDFFDDLTLKIAKEAHIAIFARKI